MDPTATSLGRRRHVFECPRLDRVHILHGLGRTGTGNDLRAATGVAAGTKVVIFHVDDAGMSYDSDRGAIQALEEGVATSMSIMMPCPWVPHIAAYLKDHPQTDAGLHLTLTSEWNNYRWGPLVGRAAAPGLVDPQGYFWPRVEDVLNHTTVEQFELEIRTRSTRP